MSQEAASAPAAKAQKQRLSSAQMLHLMRLETDQALRHRYPISCMVIGLDGFDEGPSRAHRRTIMPLVFRSLKEVCFESDVRGLGLFTERYHLAVFPHVAPEMLAQLAEGMLEKAHGLEAPEEVDGPLTLSVGISHNLHPGQVTFESLVEDAETGMGLAHAAGGDRYVQAREVETEIDRLREEIDAQISELRESQEQLIEEQGSQEEAWAKNLVQRTIGLFHEEADQSEGVLRLQKEVIALLRTELTSWRESSTVAQMLQKQRQIENLERRVRKLTESLDMTEAELKRVAAMKNIDLGVASIYRTVQGLRSEDDDFEQKSAMLQNIFEANLALQGKADSKA